MSARLAGIARKVARRRSRGIETPAFPAVRGEAVAGDPWRDIPESERETVIERRGNILVTSYVDSVEGLRRPKRHSAPLPPPEPEPVPEDPSPDHSEPVRAARPEWSRLDDADQRDEEERRP